MSNKSEFRKFHFVYKTTCLVTGKWYIGLHSTNNMDDGYLGSGVRVWRSVKKYGRDQHTREILKEFQTRKEAAEYEESIVTKELRSDPMCMNIANGGVGHNPGQYTTSEETRRKLSEASKATPRTAEWKAKIGAAHRGKKQPIEAIEKHRQKMLGYKWSPEQIAARTAGQLSSDKFKKRYRPLVIAGVVYQSGCEAVEKTGIAGSTLKYRLNSPAWVDYRYLDEPEKNGEHRGPRGHRGEYKVGVNTNYIPTQMPNASL